MCSNKKNLKYYNAFINRDSEYEGIFYVGIKTTGIFCRPTCSARNPKFENCDFFHSSQDALLAGYRPCNRCHPLSLPGTTSPVIEQLIKAVESKPEKRWKDADFKALGIERNPLRLFSN